MILTYRDRHRKRRAHTNPAFDMNRPMMKPDELADHGQTDACTLLAAALAVHDAVEPVEYLLQLIFRDTDAGVGDAHADLIPHLPHIDGDGPMITIFEGIGDEVQDDALPQIDI